MNDLGETNTKDRNGLSNRLQIVLFVTTWLVVVFIGKEIFHGIKGELDFIVKNVGTFLVSTIATVLLIRTLSERLLRLIIFCMWLIILFIVIS